MITKYLISFFSFILFFTFNMVVFGSESSISGMEVVLLNSAIKLNVKKTFDLNKINTIDDATYFKISAEEILNAEEATKIAAARLTQLRQLFGSQIAPYAGMITKSIKCKSKLWIKEKKVNSKNSILFIANLTATENFVYGSCGATTEPYTSQYILLYCKKNNTLVDFRFFTKDSTKYNLKMPLISCKI